MQRKRIQVYADPETKRRIELAAARRDVSVTQYCLEAIQQLLVEDDVLDQESIEIPVRLQRESHLISDLRALHQKILAETGGQLIDVDDILEQVRAERDNELLSLH